MKQRHIFLTMAAALLSLASVLSCQKNEPKEITELDLNRCLQPTNLSAKVVSTKGNVVVFNWDKGQDTDVYLLYIYSDAEMTKEYKRFSLYPIQLPDSIQVEADQSYWYKVQATNESKEPSKWAVYGKEIKTYAVKDALYPEVIERTSASISIEWSKDVKDYKDVTGISYNVTGSEETVEVSLTAEEIEAATATLKGLSASTEYDIRLMYLSATRGELVVWTTPDLSGTTEVNTVEGLQNAIKTSGAKILLKMEGSPYELALCDISNGFSIYGEETADGAKPVIKGEFHFADNWAAGESVYFEGIEFNGADNTYGFPIQKKNGGSSANAEIASIVYKNCNITGYSKGLIYEWGKTMTIGELTWQDCVISNVNQDGTQGGDVVDIRNASTIGKLNIVNNTINQGMRTFLRFDAAPTVGDVRIENNTLQNLCFVDNTNNAGIFGFQTVPTSVSFKKNLFLNFVSKSVLGSENTKYKTADDIGLNGSDNWFYNIHDAFFTTSYPAAKAGYNKLDADPCYNAKGGVFNILASSDISGKEIGASKWWAPYSEKPEDPTLNCLEGPVVWNFSDATVFNKTEIKKNMVRGDLFIGGSENCPFTIEDGVLKFAGATSCSKKGFPQDGYLKFIVDKSGSVVIRTKDGGAANVTVGTSTTDGVIKVVGGAATMSGTTSPTKIVIPDIEEETTVYVYASGAIGIDQLAWSEDISKVNTALPSPVPTAEPAYITAGESTNITVTWDAVPNAGGYVVKFQGKESIIEEGLLSYTVESKIASMLDKGSYMVDVYATPLPTDIYNTVSEAGSASFAVLPSGGGGETELVVKSVQELNDAIAAGKVDITLAYNATPYELGTLALTTPLRLKGQASSNSYPTVRGSITLAGEIGGSVIFTNINFDGTGVAESIIKETDVVTADTIAVIGGVIRNYTKALYDNSGKKASSVQHLIFDDIQVYDCSNASDFIDMRAGAYHNLQVTRSTFARSARTFIRTDAASEINNVLVRNNTFYKVCTISDNKDNNGLFHIRSAGGSGIQQYKIQNNLFYSILITETPANPNGYPKFISKNAAAIKPSAIMNNYFYNIQEDGDYSWWTVNCSKDEGVAGGGCVLHTDPCKNVSNDDFTLTNGVAMNAGVGDPRWNPAGGGTPTSEITVDNADDLITAISAGKKIITLSEGTYDLTAITEVEALTAGVLSITGDLSLIGKGSVTFIGGFKPTGDAIKKFSATGVKFDGNGTIGNFIDVSDATVAMSSISIKNGGISNYTNRIYSQSAASTLSSLVIDGIQSYKMGTGGDCIDIRKGTISSIKVTNSTFANGIRTFLRVDAAVVCNAITVKNNTFYNLCAVDSKDNNGIMHVRSTTMAADSSSCKVQNNLFASMHRAEAAPAQTNGFPKLVSTASQKIFQPAFIHNYYYDIETDEGKSWWNTLRGGQDDGCAGYGVVLTSSPFLDAASGDFTLTDPLTMSENIGDPRWNPSKGGNPGDAFAVSSVEDMLTAISAGKTNLSLAYGTYDLTAATSEAITAGVLTVGASLTLTGKAKSGKYPEIIGAFKLTGTSATTTDVFTLSNLSLNGNGTIGNMIDIDAAATLGNITLRNCNVSAYSGRLVSQSGASTVGNLDISGLLVKDMGTSGDFIDFRKGSVVLVSVTNSTFYNGIRTFLRMDAAVNCGSVLVKNNTFYNLCAVDSKDNNGIMHVRSGSLTAATVKVEKNIFAAMHRAEAAPTQTNGFPKLVSTASQKVFEPTFIGNIYFDFETDAGYSWWNTLSNGEATGTADGGAVLTETPFSADPATGKFTVKAAYKGYGDLRW